MAEIATGVRLIAHRGFIVSEHACAFGYAVCEFWEAHRFLAVASIAFLVSLALILLFFALDRLKIVREACKTLRYAEREI